jgi:hypothetical protein
MKIMPKVLVVTSIVLFATSFGVAAAQKNRIEIIDCVCDETVTGTYDCTIDFNGAAPAGDDEYHAHVTTEQDGVLDADGETPVSCKAQTECGGIIGADPYTATCTGASLPDPACTALLEEGFSFDIVAKVAADADGNHGDAKRVLKDNYPHCTINPYVADPA